MNQRFFELAKEKQDRIMNAALRVFARNGYHHAGTDEIVRQASISKGLLFHYFESKLGLYTFLYDYGTRFLLLEMGAQKLEEKKEYFAFLYGMETALLRTSVKYPHLRAFLYSVEEEDCVEAVEALREAREEFHRRLDALLSEVSLPACALQETGDGTDRNAQQLRRVVGYVLHGLTREYASRDSYDPEALYRENLSYLNYMERLYAGGQTQNAEEEAEQAQPAAYAQPEQGQESPLRLEVL